MKRHVQPTTEKHQGTINLIITNHRFREDHVKQIVGTENRMKGIIRRMTKCGKSESPRILKKIIFPTRKLEKEIKLSKKTLAMLTLPAIVRIRERLDYFQASLVPIADGKRKYTKYLEELAMELPIWEWAKNIPGIGALGIARVIGETGDLNNYAKISRVYKRMGVASIDGGPQRKHRNKALAEKHGYNPRRHAVIFTVGDSLLKQNKFPTGKKDEKGKEITYDGRYRMLFASRKKIEIEKALTKGKIIIGAVELSDLREKNKWDAEYCTKHYMTHLHIFLRAKRKMEKRFLLDMWAIWTDNTREGETYTEVYSEEELEVDYTAALG